MRVQPPLELNIQGTAVTNLKKYSLVKENKGEATFVLVSSLTSD